MDLLDLLKLMFRRWYVTAPVVAGTIVAAVALGISIQPEYKTSAAVLLVPPTVTAPAQPDGPPQPGNPWLRVGENAMAQAVQITVSAHDARTRVRAAGGDSGYEVSVITRSSILSVEVTAASQASARATVVELTRLVKEVVASQQAPYHPRAGEQITTEVLDPGLNIVQSRSNVLRAQIVVGVIGLLFAAATAVLFDAVARRRAVRRHGARHPVGSAALLGGGAAAVAPVPATGVTPAPVPAGPPLDPAGAPTQAGAPAPAATARPAGVPGGPAGVQPGGGLLLGAGRSATERPAD
ncbi:hypothetical protein AB0J86_35415 [Micromonospora sp. NPDC049559]|uniref:hypothetical protein n=1 Tax=Micromonospora sp. NPDC049559 TaxID=3155923 RepID=UPI00342DECB1